ncbi:MAG: hypothetical protein MUC87_01520 [Bacteroidia bacterium]|nr:hypothetical protein [Bacteroidia bacterium]
MTRFSSFFHDIISGSPNYKRFLVELLCLLVPYLYYLSQWNITEVLPGTLYSSTDSQQYKAYGEFLTGVGGYASDTRPYLFPLFVRLCELAGGVWAVWFVQALLHVGGGLLLFSVVRQTSRWWPGWWCVVLFYGTHPSLAVHTMHALTETVTVFLLSLFVYFLTRAPHADALRRVKALLVLALAVVVKPVFLYVFLCALVWLIWRERGFLFRSRALLALLGISLVCVLVQPVLMKRQQGEFFLSRIGEITLREYYFRMLYARAEGLSFSLTGGASYTDADKIDNAVKNASTGDIVRVAARNPMLAVSTGAEVVYTNIDSGSILVGQLNGGEGIAFWSEFMRKFTLGAHFAALAGMLWLLVRRKWRAFFPGFHATLLLWAYILLVSGISFWQGDRLVIFALPLWVTLYPAVYLAVWRSFRKKSMEAV